MGRCRTLISSLKGQCAQGDKRRNVGMFKWDHNTAFRAPLLACVQGTPYYFHQQRAGLLPIRLPGSYQANRAFRAVIAARIQR